MNTLKKNLFRYLKHISLTILVLSAIAIVVGLNIGASLHYDDHPLMMVIDKEGPYVFYKNNSTLQVNHIRGNKNDGFYLEQKEHSTTGKILINSYFQIDSTYFEIEINPEIDIPPTSYDDNQPILAISDIEGGYKTFRDFLIANKVIDKKLNWIFKKGHLVLVGDFVDRGWSVTQVLWFIYKLEQDAKKQGGGVHFILGNHELKNMQGFYRDAAPKYFAASNILGKQLHELYNQDSFIGKWMSSKNTLEIINGNLFVHGGIHPDLANYEISLDEINQIVRNNYYRAYYPEREKTIEQFLNSTKTGICWYRVYYKDDLTQEEVEKGLDKFNAKSVVVGHTLQSEVNRKFNGKVIGIDVKHPKDYHKNFPYHESEGLLIEENIYYRVLADGEKREI
ncbi:metallophosphoesterase [Bernardetia sp. MNP-M8]|uniref:metallophosphoesterase n=1 Tax=Bernardetia sp. MNP-M8 TaxID=3127470 RepID=UPI0030CDE15D